MIQKVEMSEFEALKRKPYNTAITRDIEEFLSMPDKICEVNFTGYKSAKSCAGSYNVSAKNMRVDVKVTLCKGRVFLLKETVNEP